MAYFKEQYEFSQSLKMNDRYPYIPFGLAIASTTKAILQAISDALVKTDSEAEESQYAANTPNQQRVEISTSQRLWNTASDNLRNDKDTKTLFQSYVDIFAEFMRVEGTSSDSASTNLARAGLTVPVVIQEFTRKLVKLGLENVGPESLKIAEELDDVVGYVVAMKKLISAVITNMPQAALLWAGISIGLRILSDPSRAAEYSLRVIVHMMSRMDWYCALAEHLLNVNNLELIESTKVLLQQFEMEIIKLYQTLLHYQIKSTCYYMNRSKASLSRFGYLNDQKSCLKTIKYAEAVVENISARYHREYEKSILHRSLRDGIEMEKAISDIIRSLETVPPQKIWTNTKNRECLKDLFVVDPRDSMREIRESKEELFGGAYNWIFSTKEYQEFTDWSDGASACRLLWITGSAGTGKTMLLIGIIDELQHSSPFMSYFFCQATKIDLNNATSILRSLIWLLLIQQPHLVGHIKPDYKRKGRAIFENVDAPQTLNAIFERMLRDPYLLPVYFIIDALDECDQELSLLRLISKSLELSDKVRWLVSTRSDVATRVHMLDNPHISRAVVKLDADRLGAPVNNYIEYKLGTLKRLKGYTEEDEEEILNIVRRKAEKTFLWVALVFKELSKVRRWNFIETIKNMPSGLPGLYDRMMGNIEKLRDQRLCKDILIAVSLALRPLSLSELANLAGLHDAVDTATSLVEKCGSFLITRGEMVSLVHLSAKDYLDSKLSPNLQLHEISRAHVGVRERTLEATPKAMEKSREESYQAIHPEDIESSTQNGVSHLLEDSGYGSAAAPHYKKI
ncbi:hypothetical protein F5Y10DRAFT_288580 [Nemania abortiva]|nr:hypothetical protein F5Y10DRAFT_288580 [Nemania abortiva]